MRPASRVVVACAIAFAAVACRRASGPDAYGNVEATDVTVKAEIGGQLLTFTVSEGQALAAGQEVGAVDDRPLALERDQVRADRGATTSRVDEAGRQIAVLEAQRAAAEARGRATAAGRAVLVSQLEIARRALARTERLLAAQAATSQQLDQHERDVRTLEAQVRAQEEQIGADSRQVAAYTAQIAAARAGRDTAAQQVDSAAARVAQVDDRIRRTRIVNPSAGTVLTTYVERGEMVQAGQPLYKIADLSTVIVRAYIAETQLAAVRVGQPATVSFDAGHSARDTLDGAVTWIASQAEFTPTPIQTREERADLVYAVKIRVPNSAGHLKIGMPVDVTFPHGR